MKDGRSVHGKKKKSEQKFNILFWQQEERQWNRTCVIVVVITADRTSATGNLAFCLAQPPLPETVPQNSLHGTETKCLI